MLEQKSSEGSAAEATAIAALGELESLPDADPRDLAHQQREALRTLLLSDLYIFSRFIFEYRDLVPRIHGKICQLIGRWGTPGYQRLMIQIPREFFKTSLCTRSNALWQICREPDLPVAIFGEKEDNAAANLRTIRDVAQSSLLFQEVFQDLCPPGMSARDRDLGRSMPRYWKWSDTEITFQRDVILPEPSIMALGVGGATAGKHFPKIIKDDIISVEAANSRTVMEKAKDWYDKSPYLERPALKGLELVVCTPWAYDDVYAHALRTYPFKLYRRSALEDPEGLPDAVTGETIFPEKLTTDELKAHYVRDPYGFNAQMQCVPQPGRDQSFDPAWLRFGSVELDCDSPSFLIERNYYDPDLRGDVNIPDTPPQRVPLSLMNKTILCDPAPSEEAEIRRETAARTALLVEGKDPWDRRFILESWAERLDPYDTILAMFSLMDKWGTDTIAIEEVNFSKLYRHWLRREAEIRGRSIRTIKLKTGKMDKGTRIREKIPGCRAGLYYWNRGETDKMIREYHEFPYGTTVDILDAWGYDNCIRRPSTASELEAREFAGVPPLYPHGTRNPITGY